VPKGKGTTEMGHTNRNGQKVLRHTDLEGNDHNQYVYVLRCNRCGQEYGRTVPTSGCASVPTARAAPRGLRWNNAATEIRSVPHRSKSLPSG
jgi:hypothetical protein